MEITCKKCGNNQIITNTGSPIVKCNKCGYPNPIIIRPKEGATPSSNLLPPQRETPLPKPTNILQTSFQAIETPLEDKVEVGWLVVHDENAAQQTHPLSIGRQVIGRKSLGAICDIMLNTSDPFMSRNHCMIEVKPSRGGGYDYLLSDCKMTNGIPEQMSVNGTFVNAYPMPLKSKDMVYLNDGDTIQMGQTKAVIKTIISASNAKDAARIVQDTDYTPTILIKH
jgi:pSer/pThr/pTyr-binding forkhead associated (FHA) protein/ribosomal protein L37E